MSKFTSDIKILGTVGFPEFSGTRVMMMPFHMHDPAGSLPDTLAHYRVTIRSMCRMFHTKGVGYLTIDEAFVRQGETHRRPGLHVDGVGPDGLAGAWGGGGGGGWGKTGMLVTASRAACRGWNKEFVGAPGPNGDCAHLADQCKSADAMLFEANRVYWCSPFAVHESLPMTLADAWRQFVRISMPNDAPWYEGYTPNPLGIKPNGPIHSARSEFMSYRP